MLGNIATKHTQVFSPCFDYTRTSTLCNARPHISRRSPKISRLFTVNMGFVEHVLFPAVWVALIAWNGQLIWNQPAYLFAVPFEIFYFHIITSVVGEAYASLFHLFSYILLLIRAIVYILGFILASVRFLLFLPLLIMIPLLFWIYCGLYTLVSRFLGLSGLLFSALLALFSKICIVRWPRFRKPQSTLESKCVDGCIRRFESKPCLMCDNLVDASALLTGTWWLFTKPVEVHLHHTELDLKQSAESCALCYLLLGSKFASSHIAPGSTSQYGSISNLEAATERLMVKIWEQRHVLAQPTLRIQLVGRGIESRSLAVGQVKNGRCFSHPDPSSIPLTCSISI